MNELDRLPIPLLEWYRDNARALPWRPAPGSRTLGDPYRVWVSEIMLQQTRVAAVLDYYQRFMAALPTVEALAAVEEDRLMKLWQGLGYYNRARNLRKAAQQITGECGGRFPDTYEGLLALAGVGEYTAGAIASIAFGAPVPAVDGNVLRVVSRITGDEGDIARPETKKRMRSALQAVMPRQDPGDFNQAMMELGAMVCLPNGAPLCEQCPARTFCTACEKGLQRQLPVREKKKEKREIPLTVFAMVREDGAAALRQRPKTGLLAGLWELPHVEGTLDEGAAARQLAAWGVTVLRWERTLHAKHEFTHLRWQMTGYLLTVAGEGQPDWLWADASQRRQRAIPSAFRVFTAALENAAAGEKSEKGD